MNEFVDAIRGVDPEVWLVLGGALAPFVQQGIKKVKDLNRSQNYVISVLLAGIVGIVGTAIDAGTFGANTGIAFLVSQVFYGFLVKVNEELKVLKSTQQF